MLIEKIKDYYNGKFVEYGASVKGVDWKDEVGQSLRFKYIFEFIKFQEEVRNEISILDLGCGYGGLLDFILQNKIACKYCGIDLVPDMIKTAKSRHPKFSECFYVGEWNKLPPSKRDFDFVVSNGIFNVKTTVSDKEFEQYMLETIQSMFALAKTGIVFNLMTPCPIYKDEHLFYPNIARLFTFLYEKLSREIRIMTSTSLWEMTIAVLKA